ncbi:Flp family type IVb pilin [Novosphingobium sp.]|uniref:Flp family type IVb pilin n=1 Tax=Novosphingobium sp. TaxID=1874826 RepID=UPI002B47510E|nr:Flp family type IVb pilin [Novosphingobium sp.]HKR92299.1 Flp family type IVb pilin [Novosphingobium sp.]
MTKLITVRKVLRDQKGASSVEYGLILAMIVLVMLIAMQGVANQTISYWQNISTTSANAISGS